ncbi:DUF1254 domain-containing protein [Rhizobium sp. ARZ01]|uniref:DUF1254 domain-containing protein n=1 Tax=Rhizobium sp. ARZ01 TaxID=2769313 RepID=UPI0017830D0B|nr:DUF1254 domain-containing protein [Rhizobium sp. ARZ01]MBD9371025.1 DUF1254 domain-containing protein [Rhizobium sp. ARZ01]
MLAHSVSRITILRVLFVIAMLGETSASAQQDPASTHEELVHQQMLQRGTQAAIWGISAVSMMGLRRGAERDLGATFSDILYSSQLFGPRQAFLTANNQTPNVIVMLDTTDGPVVLEVPPASDRTVFFGSIIDAWQVPLADVGPQGEDAGKGGKYLVLPPGYDKPLPDGYLVSRPKTYHTYVALRPIAVHGGTLAEAVAYSKKLKAYPLSDPTRTGRYIDVFPKAWNTLPAYDISYFADLAAVITEEPVQEKDLAMMGMLSSIGISKGQPFQPDSQTQRTLQEAIKLAYAMMQDYFTTPGKALIPYWPGSQWQSAHLSKEQAEAGFPFATADELLIDERAGGIYFWATWLPKYLGAGTFYLLAMRDSGGALFDGTSLYRLKVPKEVPARDFWSAIVYSMETKAFVRDASKVGISSYEKADLKASADGAIDLYFGPKSPDGLEANWLPTGGKPFFLIFRLYGPEKALFDKTWTLPDVEKVR